MTGTALTVLGSIIVAVIAALASVAVARNNRQAQEQDRLTAAAKEYLDDALSHAREEIDDLRERVQAGDEETSTLRAEVRGLRAELVASEREVRSLKTQIAELRTDLSERDAEIVRLRAK